MKVKAKLIAFLMNSQGPLLYILGTSSGTGGHWENR